MNYRISTEGLMCGHCDASVETELLKLAGVTDADADHETQTVVVEADRELSRAELDTAIKAAGEKFRIVSVTTA